MTTLPVAVQAREDARVRLPLATEARAHACPCSSWTRSFPHRVLWVLPEAFPPPIVPQNAPRWHRLPSALVGPTPLADAAVVGDEVDADGEFAERRADGLDGGAVPGVVRQRQRNSVGRMQPLELRGVVEGHGHVALNLTVVEGLAEAAGIVLRACATLGLNEQASAPRPAGDDIDAPVGSRQLLVDRPAPRRKVVGHGLDYLLLGQRHLSGYDTRSTKGNAMDPRKLFVDERLTGVCAYCSGPPDTRDHVPSRVLLDDPLPGNLPVVDACRACNEGFSQDEEYVACLIECAVTGACDPAGVVRPKVKRTLAKSPALAARLAQCRSVVDGRTIWEPDHDRVRNVLLKLAQGHMVYELSLPGLGEPEVVDFMPFICMTDDDRAAFESPDDTGVRPWPEIGSRAFIRAAFGFGMGSMGRRDDWLVVQEGRYRYRVSDNAVQMVLSEYLACHVIWP